MATPKLSPSLSRSEVDSGPQKPEILSGWKDVANYLGKGVRTVQRYERELALPVRRPAGKTTASVIATKAELDAWVSASPIREAFQVHHPAVDNAVVLNEFRHRLKQLRRLRQESAVLREELHVAVVLLRENVRCFIKQDHNPELYLMNRGLADLLAFDSTTKKVN